MTEPVMISIPLTEYLSMNSRITLRMYLRNLYSRMYYYTFYKLTALMVWCERRGVVKVLDKSIRKDRKKFDFKTKRSKYWVELLSLERSVLIAE